MKKLRRGPPMLDDDFFLELELEGAFQDPREHERWRYLDAAARYYARVRRRRGEAPGSGFRRAMTTQAPANPLRRTALYAALQVASSFRRGPATPFSRAFLARLENISRPLGEDVHGAGRDQAYAVAAEIAETFATIYGRVTDWPDDDVGRAIALREGRKAALDFVMCLWTWVHPDFGRLLPRVAVERDKLLEEVAGLLRRYDPKPRGKQGRIGAASILAPLLIRARAFGHSDTHPEEHVRKAIEAAIRRHRRRLRESTAN